MKVIFLRAFDSKVSMRFFYKDGFGVKYSITTYMPLKRETKLKNFNWVLGKFEIKNEHFLKLL